MPFNAAAANPAFKTSDLDCDAATKKTVNRCDLAEEGKKVELNGEAENGISQGARLKQRTPSPTPALQNGVPSSPEQETPPRKKRGRWKLEHPEKHVEEEEEEEKSCDSIRTEEEVRGRGGLRRKPVPRVTYQAGDPFYISRREREELAKLERMMVRETE